VELLRRWVGCLLLLLLRDDGMGIEEDIVVARWDRLVGWLVWYGMVRYGDR
jgi:hypothetical protein